MVRVERSSAGFFGPLQTAFELCVCSKISHYEIEKHHLKFVKNVRNFRSNSFSDGRFAAVCARQLVEHLAGAFRPDDNGPNAHCSFIAYCQETP